MGAQNVQKVASIRSKAKVAVSDDDSTTLRVAVRVRPVLKSGVRASEATQKDIMRVAGGNQVLVLDPDEEKLYLDKVQGRTKEKQYAYDVALDQRSTNLDVYTKTVKDMILGCIEGQSVTVFAYGATGSGKTHTMVGREGDPGLMVLSLESIFDERSGLLVGEEVGLTASYIEVYNEVVYDLLVPNSGSLDLREDPKLGVCVAGIRRHEVSSPGEIMRLLQEGNKRRKTDSTGANATSSRSHAVLEVRVARKARVSGAKAPKAMHGKLCMVDLAGNERGAETNNMGQKLRDGANINKSLLALANCINALGKASKGKGGKPYVPYRNSKLTRLLKDGLSGNSKTAMIATVSASADQYHNSINTLKYADRAKEIKTKAVVQRPATQRRVDVEPNVPDQYQRIINDLQGEVQTLREQLEASELDAALPAIPETATLHRASELDRMRWINRMSADIGANSEERINLQKALLELEDASVCNRAELEQLEEYVQSGGLSRADTVAAQERIKDVLASIKEYDAEGAAIRKEIDANEVQRRQLQTEIDVATSNNTDAPFLQMVMSFRMQALKLQEQQFQTAVRDQIIFEHRAVINNLWSVIEGSGMSREDVEAIGRQQGLMLDGVGSHLHSVPGGTLRLGGGGGGGMGGGTGMFKTIRQAGNRAHARYEFWRKRDARVNQQGGTTSVGVSRIGGLFKSIKNFWSGNGSGATTRRGVATRKVAVAPF